MKWDSIITHYQEADITNSYIYHTFILAMCQ
jgi:hypothetical protein